MTYLAFCTFDLKNASRQDYVNAYADLQELGLARVMKSSTGNDVVIPTTSVMGEFTGKDAPSVRDGVRQMVRDAFAARGFKSEIFVVIGGNWTWGATTT
jgi:hypothetical protein